MLYLLGSFPNGGPLWYLKKNQDTNPYMFEPPTGNKVPKIYEKKPLH